MMGKWQWLVNISEFVKSDSCQLQVAFVVVVVVVIPERLILPEYFGSQFEIITGTFISHIVILFFYCLWAYVFTISKIAGKYWEKSFKENPQPEESDQDLNSSSP